MGYRRDFVPLLSETGRGPVLPLVAASATEPGDLVLRKMALDQRALTLKATASTNPAHLGPKNRGTLLPGTELSTLLNVVTSSPKPSPDTSAQSRNPGPHKPKRPRGPDSTRQPAAARPAKKPKPHAPAHHTYRDYSCSLRVHTSHRPHDLNARLYPGTQFPERVHYMLDRCSRAGLAGVIAWRDHGRAFIVHDTERFVRCVLPLYFKHSKWPSFQRQLNLYGFRRLGRGADAGSYYHELFLRGFPGLSRDIERVKIKGTGSKACTAPVEEPDFYGMPTVGAGGSYAVKGKMAGAPDAGAEKADALATKKHLPSANASIPGPVSNSGTALPPIGSGGPTAPVAAPGLPLRSNGVRLVPPTAAGARERELLRLKLSSQPFPAIPPMFQQHRPPGAALGPRAALQETPGAGAAASPGAPEPAILQEVALLINLRKQKLQYLLAPP